MKISLKGYGENTATFKTKYDVTPGEPVYFSDNHEVTACNNGDRFAGSVVNTKDGYACVQLDGYTTFKYSGSEPSVGFGTLVGDGNGGVRTDAAGRQYIITDVDTVNSTVGIIL